MNTLVIPGGLWRRLREHLLADTEERVGFMLVKAAGPRLIVRDLVLIPDEDLECATDSVSVSLAALIDVMNRAVREDVVLVEAHSHPLAPGRVSFSPIDEQGQAELVEYLSDVIPGRAYGALVVGHRAVQGRVWRDATPAPLNRILVTGEVLDQWPGDGSPPSSSSDAFSRPPAKYDRQVRAFGPEGHDRIASSSVAIAGLGGIGSIVAQELAHLGVQDIVLIDEDRIENSNLNRLVGATPSDVGRLKVDVAAEQCLRVHPEAWVTTVPAQIRDQVAIAAAANVDVLFGCVDTDSGRLILNELAVTHAIPYIDCGTGINAPDGSIDHAGGRVIAWVPGRPCLLCCREIDRAAAAAELESDEQRAFRRREGYVTGADVPEPAVISLNGTVASLAVTEFLALVTGFRAAKHYTYYDMLDQRVGPRLVERDPQCYTCSLEGIGDGADLARYGRVGLTEGASIPS